jgi:protein phosphatase
LYIRVVAKSVKGNTREQNEDNIGFFPDKYMCECPENNIYIVADGMGGAVAGELASKVVVDTIKEFFVTAFSAQDINACVKTMEYVILKANNILREHISSNLKLQGMGTTVVALHFDKNKACIVHVGDSRCYRIRNNKIERLTTDHSVVQELYETGQITFDEIHTHPKRNMITRAIGTEQNVTGDINIVSVKQNDIFLLCSDGLSSVLQDNRIMSIILQNVDNLNVACEQLIDEVHVNGGMDDISMIVIHVVEMAEKYWIKKVLDSICFWKKVKK